MAGTALSAGFAAGGGGGGASGFFSAQAERPIVAARIGASIIDRYLRMSSHFLPVVFKGGSLPFPVIIVDQSPGIAVKQAIQFFTRFRRRPHHHAEKPD